MPAMRAQGSGSIVNIASVVAVAGQPGYLHYVATKGAVLSMTKGLAKECGAAGVRVNVDVAVQYLEAWLRGAGAVAIHNLMEDAATAEISRAQLWQWIHHDQTTEEGTAITKDWYRQVREEELAKLSGPLPYADAAGILDSLVLADDFLTFLTLPAYQQLNEDPPA